MKYLVGFGNYAMGDDSVGLRIVEYIAENSLDNGFTPVEVGNNGMQLLTYFEEDTELIVIVDAVKFGGEPGDMISFSPEDVTTEKQLAGISTHEGDVMRLFELAKSIGQHIPEIKILAVEPAAMEVDTGLSDKLAGRFNEYVETTLSAFKGD
jgi:hydrogenase maturation protease